MKSKGLYMKKPVVVEAMQLCWGNWNEMCEFAGVGKLEDGKPQGCYLDAEGQPLPENKTSNTMGLLIPTREGVMIACQGDYIIKEPRPTDDRKFYPCKLDIFISLYVKVGGV